MRNIFKILFLVFLLSYLSPNLDAQIIGINYNATWHTNYIYNNYDTIYIYNASGADLFTKTGSLKVLSPDSTKGWTFVWEKYSLTDTLYKQFASTPSDSISIVNNLTSGAYQVRITKGARDTIFRAWIIINKLRLHLKKNDKGEVRALTYFCKYLPLGIVDRKNGQEDSTLRYFHDDNLVYVNPERKGTVSIANPITVDWKANPVFPMDYTYTNDKLQIFIHNAPVPDKTDTTVFTINFSDKFGNTATDNVKYKTQNTKADFDILFKNPDKAATNKYIKLDSIPPDTLDAPLNVKFKNNSKRGVKFEWFAADTFLNSNTKDSAHYIKTDTSNSGSYTYYRPYTYKVKLISTSPEGCTDTSKYHKVKVADSQLGGSLHFPNAFTPGNNDTRNDYFTYKSDSTFSIRNLHLTIFNQWGSWVWEYNGSIPYGWEGWNGTIGKLKLEARPGIYYYTYEAIGWGPIKQGSDSTHFNLPFDKKLGSGFVYLFRK
jgi:hypothetical protein